MDSRESPVSQQPPLQHHQQPPPQYHQHLSPQHHQHPPPQHHQQPQQQPQVMMMAPPLDTYTAQIPNNNTNNNNNNNIDASTTALMQQNPQFPFNSGAPKPLDSMNSQYTDGSSPSSGFRAGGLSIEPARKKRGRPRKYSADGNIALALSPTPVTPNTTVGHGDSGAGTGTPTPASESSSKKGRGRPPSSGKKQLDALGSYGVGFTPHVITVKAGEDVASTIMAFSQQGPRTVCILSANGAICNVTLRQSAMSGGTVSYEGRFEIISLSGSFLLSESNGNRSRTGGLSVSLAGADGRVLGGVVAGMLMAASPVQVIVGSFIPDGKKPKSGPAPTPPPAILNFGAPVPAVSPPSEGGSSEPSDESGSSSLNRGGPGPYSNASQPIPPMYANIGWPNSTMNMLPN